MEKNEFKILYFIKIIFQTKSNLNANKNANETNREDRAWLDVRINRKMEIMDSWIRASVYLSVLTQYTALIPSSPQATVSHHSAFEILLLQHLKLHF